MKKNVKPPNGGISLPDPEMVTIHQEPGSKKITKDDLLQGLLRGIAKKRLEAVNGAKLVAVQAHKAYEGHLNRYPDLERDRLHKAREDAKTAYFEAADPQEYSDEIEDIISSMMLDLCNVT